MHYNKLNSGIEDGLEVTLKLSSNFLDDCNDKNNFPHKLLLANTKVLRPCKALANISSTNIKSSNTQLHKIGQSGEFLGTHLGPLLETWLSLMKNVLKPLVEYVSTPLGLRASASATDAAIGQKIFGLCMTALISQMKKGLMSRRYSNHLKNLGYWSKVLEK